MNKVEVYTQNCIYWKVPYNSKSPFNFLVRINLSSPPNYIVCFFSWNMIL